MSVLAEIAQKLKHKILPLTPYSPDLNPIEKVWLSVIVVYSHPTSYTFYLITFS